MMCSNLILKIFEEKNLFITRDLWTKKKKAFATICNSEFGGIQKNITSDNNDNREFRKIV